MSRPRRYTSRSAMAGNRPASSVCRLLIAASSALLLFSASLAVTRGATQLRYVAIGDSLTRSGSDSSAGWVNLYTSDLNADLHTSTATSNFGMNGATSFQIADEVERNSSTQAALAAADVITYGAGINDFLFTRGPFIDGSCGGADNQDCLRTMVSVFDGAYDRLESDIRSFAPGAVLRTMDIYYSVAAYDQENGYFPTLNFYLAQMNARIHAGQNALVAELHAAYNGPDGTDDPYAKGYILPDGVHATALGHQVIADAFRALAYAGLDNDSDAVADATDNCSAVANPDQANHDANLVDLPPPWLYDDSTWLNSDALGDACDPDADNDGLPNDVETLLGPGGAEHQQCPSASANTDPLKLDTDSDGYTDRAECVLNTDPVDPASHPPAIYATGDTDRDGLPDLLEARLGTDPNNADSDGDRLIDGVEFLRYGSDPLDANSDDDVCSDGREAASFNDDTKVNSTDLLIVAKAQSVKGEARYVWDFDVNKDEKINSTDLLLVAKLQGTC